MTETQIIELRDRTPTQLSKADEATEATDQIKQPAAVLGSLQPAVSPVEALENSHDVTAKSIEAAPRDTEPNAENGTPSAIIPEASPFIDVPHDDENPCVAPTNPPPSPAESSSGSQNPEGQETSNFIVLKSDVPFIQSWSAWAFAISSSIFTVSTLFYIWWTSFATFKLKFQDPQWTVFTIAVLSYVSAILLNRFTETMCDVLRWKFSRRTPRGIPMLKFLALSQATSPLGLFFLLVHTKNFKLSVLNEHRLWCLLRFPLALHLLY
jgi:hypothetical protein